MADYHLWTIQIAKWRLAQFRGVKFLNIAAKGGVLPFAPDMSNVMRYKRGEMTEDEYTACYLSKMAMSCETYPAYWERLLFYRAVAFGCYCPPGKYCHRLLFVDLAKQYLEARGHRVILHGEMTNEPINDEQQHEPTDPSINTVIQDERVQP